MNPKKITGCSQPYDIEEMLVALSDMGQANIKEYFDAASQKICKLHSLKTMFCYIFLAFYAYQIKITKHATKSMEIFNNPANMIFNKVIQN